MVENEVVLAEENTRKEEGDRYLEIKVHGSDIERALKSLKNHLQKEGLFREIKRRRFYEKPSVKIKRKQTEARKKRMKTFRFTAR